MSSGAVEGKSGNEINPAPNFLRVLRLLTLDRRVPALALPVTLEIVLPKPPNTPNPLRRLNNPLFARLILRLKSFPKAPVWLRLDGFTAALELAVDLGADMPQTLQ